MSSAELYELQGRTCWALSIHLGFFRFSDLLQCSAIISARKGFWRTGRIYSWSPSKALSSGVLLRQIYFLLQVCLPCTLHFFQTLCMSKDDACPLGKSVRPMQLFTLYNFASNTAVIQGGRHGRLGPISPDTHSFHPARPFCDLWSIEDTLCPLWKSVRPMQLFTLYNFASGTTTEKSGQQGHFQLKPWFSPIQTLFDPVASGKTRRFNLKLTPYGATFHGVQLCKQKFSLKKLSILVVAISNRGFHLWASSRKPRPKLLYQCLQIELS
jgi:hypothetical protein